MSKKSKLEEAAVEGELAGELANDAGVEEVERKPEKADIRVWSVYPKYEFVVSPAERGYEKHNGKIIFIKNMGRKINFWKNQAKVTASDLERMQGDPAYGVHMISDADLQARKKTDPKWVRNFIEECLRRAEIAKMPLEIEASFV